MNLLKREASSIIWVWKVAALADVDAVRMLSLEHSDILNPLSKLVYLPKLYNIVVDNVAFVITWLLLRVLYYRS